MTANETEVAIIGGGAAGIAAGRRLRAAGVDCLLIEARPGSAAALGRSPTRRVRARPRLRLAAFGRPQSVGEDRRGTRPHHRQDAATWTRPSLPIRFSLEEQQDFAPRWTRSTTGSRRCLAKGGDAAASAALLEPGGRWNNLITAVGTFISGGELDRVSARDFIDYQDTGVNWSVVEGYGATIAAAGGELRVALDCAVTRIDHSEQTTEGRDGDRHVAAERPS